MRNQALFFIGMVMDFVVLEVKRKAHIEDDLVAIKIVGKEIKELLK